MPVKRPEPRIPQSTTRQWRSKACELRWEDKQERLRQELPPSSIDRKPRKRRRTLRGPELVRALELGRDSTGDPRFTVALEVVYEYGFDSELERNASRAQKETFGDEADYLVQVDFLHRHGKLEVDENGEPERRKLSVYEACEVVVSDSGKPGQSFKAVVERLRKQYLAARGPRPRPVLVDQI